MLVVLAVAGCFGNRAAAGMLDMLRSDVRATSESNEEDDDRRDDRHHGRHHHDGDNEDGDDSLLASILNDSGMTEFAFRTTLFTVTAPFWVPTGLTGDDHVSDGYFRRFPYDHRYSEFGSDGYLLIRDLPIHPRRWAGRFQFEHGDDFNRMNRLGGRLLLDTTSRFGLDIESHHFEEHLVPTNRYDTLWLGDANITFRFA